MSDGSPTTDKPFHEALQELRRAGGRKVTYREIAERSGGRVATSAVGQVAIGAVVPNPNIIEIIAGVFDVPPSYFIEWRLAEVRAMFDDRGPGGMAAALDNYRALERDLPASSKLRLRPGVPACTRRARRLAV